MTLVTAADVARLELIDAAMDRLKLLVLDVYDLSLAFPEEDQVMVDIIAHGLQQTAEGLKSIRAYVTEQT